MKLHIQENYHYNTNQIVYHGTNVKLSVKDFDTNRIPCFFSPYKEYSASFGKIVKAYTLDIRKPFILDNQQAVDIYNKEFIPYAEKKGWTENWDDIVKFVKIGDKISFVVADYLYPFLRRMKRNGIYNYDGIICSEGNSEYDESYVPLDSSQIHDVTDIQESLKLLENYEIPKSTYEYCLKNFMYPNYNKVPKGAIYHNTHLEYVGDIAHNGILTSKAKQLEYSGNMTWATTLPNQKGYGGCTVAFTLDGLEDRYDYEKVNNTEYTIYTDIPAKNILFIDLPVVDGNGLPLTRLSDIPELLGEYGYNKVKKVFEKQSHQYIPLDDIIPYIQGKVK